MIKANSSTINHYTYDHESHTLTVVFKQGGTYKYLDIPQTVYEAFHNSSSKGTFLHENIKKFKTTKI